jgi:hypothetical protein
MSVPRARSDADWERQVATEQHGRGTTTGPFAQPMRLTRRLRKTTSEPPFSLFSGADCIE